MKLGPEGKGWRYLIILVLIIAALFGIQQCSDSSWYTFKGEKINRWLIGIPAAILVILFLIWVYKANKPKKK